MLLLSHESLRQGFLTEYSQISMEQDFNETAAHLFTNPEIWQYCARFPRLDQKVDVMIDFYRQLHPEMDRLYFRAMSAQEAEERKKMAEEEKP